MENSYLNGNYDVVVISPKALDALDKIKKQPEKNEEKIDKTGELQGSLDGLSSIMRQKVEMQKKKDDVEKRALAQKDVKQTIKDAIIAQVKEQGIDEDFSEADLEDMVNSMTEDGTAEEMLQQAEAQVRHELAEILQKHIDNKKENIKTISISDLEKYADDIENKEAGD